MLFVPTNKNLKDEPIPNCSLTYIEGGNLIFIDKK